MSLFRVKTKLQVIGPEGIAQFIKSIRETVRFTMTFPLLVEEVGEGIVIKESEYIIQSLWVEHSIPNLSYALIENERPGKFYPEKASALNVPMGSLRSKLQHGEQVTLPDGRIVTPRQVLGAPRSGRKVVYSGDTQPCEAIVRFAKGADLLIYEATHEDKLAEESNKCGHSTPSQGALIAKEAGVKKLILTHIGGRYNDLNGFLKEAYRIFPQVQIAEDFMELKIPYPE
jgi:ribonuclease Z